MAILRRGGRERGASLVEFAILLPVFMTLILGMFSGGLAYNRQMALRQATREGARYGATLARGGVATFPSGTWATNVRDAVVERAEEQITASQVCVAMVTGTGAGTLVVANPTGVLSGTWYSTSGAPCYDDGGTDGKRRVQVSVQSSADIEALVFSRTINLDAQSTARHEAG